MNVRYRVEFSQSERPELTHASMMSPLRQRLRHRQPLSMRDMTDVISFGWQGGNGCRRVREVRHPLDAGELADPRISLPSFPAPIACRTPLQARGRSADMRLSCINDELLEHFDLSSCVSPGPPPTLAFPL